MSEECKIRCSYVDGLCVATYCPGALRDKNNKLHERIAELEQKNSEMFGELNRQELAIKDLRLRNQELREALKSKKPLQSESNNGIIGL